MDTKMREFMCACWCKDKVKADQLISTNEINYDYVYSSKYWNHLPIIQICKNKWWDIFEMFYNNSTIFDEYGFHGNNILHILCRNRSKESTEYALKIIKNNKMKNIGAVNWNGKTPLIYACENKMNDVIDRLLPLYTFEDIKIKISPLSA